MLVHCGETLQTLKITAVEARQANVLDMDTLPADWTSYDLVVTASMLEYVPRSGCLTLWQCFAGDWPLTGASSSL
jgi:hypothetical protein